MGWFRRLINNLISSHRANKVIRSACVSENMEIQEEIKLHIALAAGKLGRRAVWGTMRHKGYNHDTIKDALFRLESEKKIRLVDPYGEFSGFECGYYEFV